MTALAAPSSGPGAGAGPEPAAPQLPTRLDSLTGLRWIAAGLVFGTHFAGLGLAAPDSVTGRTLHALFGQSGPVGVSCFFLLSGFVLTWSALAGAGPGPAPAFWRRRAARIYPLYALTSLIGALGLRSVLGLPPVLVVLTHVLLAQSFVPDQRYSLAMNPVTWSLSCEAFFYLCFPLLYARLTRLPTATLRAAMIAAGTVPLAVPWLAGQFVTLHTPMREELVDTSGYGGPVQGWVANLLPPVRLAEFVIGMIAAVLVRRGSWRGPGPAPAAAVATAAALLVGVVPGYLKLVCVTLVPITVLVAALARADATGQRTPLARSWSRWLGEISFAFYAIHFVIVMGVGSTLRAWSAWWQVLAASAVLLTLSVGAAWALHRWVEQPLQQVLTRGRATSASPRPRAARRR